VIHWISKQAVHQIHQQRHAHTKANMNVYNPIVNYQGGGYQSDIMFFPAYKHTNRGFEMILMIINTNTRVLWGKAMKNKNANTILSAMNEFLHTHKDVNSITSDNGSEFISRMYINLMKRNDIKQYLADVGDHNKLGIVDRVSRTIRERLNKYLTQQSLLNKPLVWYTVLDDVIKAYNNAFHSGIGMAPNDMTEQKESIYIENKRSIADVNMANRNSLIKYGDIVRLRVHHNKLVKKDEIYSRDIYMVENVLPSGRIQLRDTNNNIMKNTVNFSDVEVVKIMDVSNQPSTDNETKSEEAVDTKKDARKHTRVDKILRADGIDQSNIITGTRRR